MTDLGQSVVPGVTAEVVTITPQMAERMLATNVHNRAVAAARVEQYAADIAAGEWVINGEAIKVADDGTILDGQHRLFAITKAERPIQTLLITGLPAVAQETMDQGRARGFSDVLKLRGEHEYNNLAAVTRMVCLYERDGIPAQGSGKVGAPSVPQLSRTLAEHPGIRESVAFAAKLRRVWCPVSTVAALHYLFASADAPSANAFFKALATGENLAATSPIYVLRERLIAEHGDQERGITAKVRLAFIIRAWNAYMDGETIARLVWNPGGSDPDRFPTIRGLNGGRIEKREAPEQPVEQPQSGSTRNRRHRLDCTECGERMRGPSSTGKCGFCDPSMKPVAA